MSDPAQRQEPQNLKVPKEFLDWLRTLNDFDLLMVLSEISDRNFNDAMPVIVAIKRNQVAYAELQDKLSLPQRFDFDFDIDISAIFRKIYGG